ncbi:hypothetical protein PsYK624_089820 [Phanerochaete sordida]|uniref:Protein SQS1 n=1 Tax=Phanerochaete sordida TaxID=48140 RepID=A0A9P3GFM2_9APHY|nr:hypothetical protein PsYK624_089820 [Phanerochaete sordida]
MARGRGSDRGGNRGGHRGNGRGGFRGRGRGRGRGDGLDEFADFSIYDWTNNAPRGTASNGANTPNYRGRGRGSGYSTPRGGTPRGGYATPNRGFDSPRGRGRPRYNTLQDFDEPDLGMGRGRGSPYDRGRGRGRGGKNLAGKLKAGAPLSKLLYEDRPLLRPIVFVRSVHTATLFEEKEEILKPLAEDTANDEASHVPTAAQINRVFGTADEDASDEEQLEEIDFSEIGRFQAEVDATAAKQANSNTEVISEVTVVEEKFTGFYIDTNPAPVKDNAPRRDTREILGDDDDDEIIVYVAPHPRAGPATPPPETSAVEALPTTSILTGLVPPPLAPEPLIPTPVEAADDTVMAEAAPEVPHPEDVEETPEEHAIAASPALEVAVIAEEPTEAPVEPSVEVPQAVEASIAETEPKPLAPATESIAAVATADAVPESAAEVAATEATAAEPASVEPADAGPSTQPAATEDFAFSFAQTTEKKTYTRRLHPARTPRSLIKRGTRTRRKPARGFSSFGASLAEAQLRREDPRKAERRIGDSDLEWGDEDDEVEALSNGVGDMAVDDEIDVDAMRAFVKSMSAEGSRQVTMDDIADAARMKEEDEDDDERGSESADSEEEDSEVEEVVRMEEELMVAEDAAVTLEGGEDEDEDAEGEDDGDDDEDSDDEFDSPRRGFQARLQRMRERTANGKGKAKATGPPDSDEDEDDVDFEMALEQSWADDDEDFIAHIQGLVNEGQEILSRKDRKLQNQLFRSIRDGDIDYDEYEEMMGRPAKRNKDKPKHLPDDLQAQWEADRAKKAENKRKRAQARLEAAADPLSKKKGGKKGMKAMLAAARYEDELPNRIVDLASLEQQIRRFLADIGGPRTLDTPPAAKEVRKKIHELADAFSLKSQSKGKGDARYTVLTKTTFSGAKINERKIRRVLNNPGHWDTTGSARGGQGGSKGVSLAKHREGEEVGKAAPKIGQGNIGFKMLASMGWAEGDQIGLSGGLEAPLTAKMKKTKLGLGAIALA